MIPYSVMDHTYIGREICCTVTTVRIVEKQRIVNTVKYAAGQRPVNDLVLLLVRFHVIYILRIVSASYSCFHTCELIILFYDVSDISTATDSGKFSVRYICAVHDDCCYSPHSFASNIIPPNR